VIFRTNAGPDGRSIAPPDTRPDARREARPVTRRGNFGRRASARRNLLVGYPFTLLIGALVGALLDWRERRRTRLHLDRLDDRLLKDVGLERDGQDYRVSIRGPSAHRQIDWRR